jgi:hypothetical protein
MRCNFIDHHIKQLFSVRRGGMFLAPAPMKIGVTFLEFTRTLSGKEK